MEYVVRSNAMQPEKRWELTPYGLEVTWRASTGEMTAAVYPYDSIAGVRLAFTPTRVDTAQYQCTIHLKPYGILTFQSTHYVSFGSFENRGATYIPFVRELLARVAEGNPGAEFRAGKRPLTYFLEQAFFALMLAFLIFAISLVGPFGLSGFNFLRIGLLLVYFPLAGRYIVRNWPRTFAAGAIPENVLPRV